MKAEIPYHCEMLLDQNRFVGNDPVGHACMKEATWETPEGFLVCDNCKRLLTTQPEQLTFPPFPIGKSGQQKIIQNALEDLQRTLDLSTPPKKC